MTSSVHKDRILRIIDQLRQRKARPDMERICHMVARKYGLSYADTETYVEKLVDSGALIKVDFKGSISYRNASRLRKKSYRVNVLNSSSASKLIRDAVETLCKDTVLGANPRDIENSIRRKKSEDGDEGEDDEDTFLCPMHIILQREVEAGRLEKLDNGNYIIALQPAKTKTSAVRRLHSVVTKRGRPPKRKLNRCFSSDYPMSSAAPPIPAHPSVPLCDFCQLSEEFNRKGVPEKLLICKECNAKAHPFCMDYSEELARRALHSPWQCIECKTCCLCEDAGDPDCILFCDACDKGYHTKCHQPEVEEKPQGKWVCSRCLSDGVRLEDIETSISPADSTTFDLYDSGSTIDLLPPSCSNESSSLGETSTTDRRLQNDSLVTRPKFPRQISRPQLDASEWTVDDVVRFFRDLGFEKQAEAFREQEIDGKSLLLMKRNDVLTGLAIRLGPALKIYQHVMKLQTNGHVSY
ncbi:hypothetical protein ACJMK2_041781 [Sinanodonta woodiana]|uniref:Histone acetyltransferase n=1 Tax=Sinanodonta woodiana TaxID=1069815 RepID=A0ABD3W582_SINWO